MDYRVFWVCAFLFSCSCSLDLDGRYYRPETDTEVEIDDDTDIAEFEPDVIDVPEEDPVVDTDIEDTAEDDATEDDPVEDDPVEDDATEDDPAEDEMPMVGDLDVRTTPGGANVVLSGSDMCTAPCIIHNVPVGTYTMQLKLTGYYLVELEVEVFDSTTTLVDEALEVVVANCDMPSCIWRLEGTSTCYTVTQEYGVVYGLPLGPHYIRGFDLENFYDTNPYTSGNTDGTCSNAWLEERLDGVLVRTHHLQCVTTCP